MIRDSLNWHGNSVVLGSSVTSCAPGPDDFIGVVGWDFGGYRGWRERNDGGGSGKGKQPQREVPKEEHRCPAANRLDEVAQQLETWGESDANVAVKSLLIAGGAQVLGGGPENPVADIISGGAGLVSVVFGTTAAAETGAGALLHGIATGNPLHAIAFGAQQAMLKGSELGKMSEMAEGLADYTTGKANSEIEALACQ